MAKSQVRLEAVRLRSRGESVRNIVRQLKVAKSTASLWTRHVILSIEQLERLRGNSFKGAERGRTIGALNQKRARLLRIEQEKERGLQSFSELSPQELKIAGLCLFKWLWIAYGISKRELKCAVGINEAHKNREGIVKNYWSKTCGF